MAVNGLCGDLGNGKTLSAVAMALEHWVRGGVVVSNISFKWELVKAHCLAVHGVTLEDRQLKLIDAEQVRDFHRHTLKGTVEMPVFLMIDECARNWDSKAWNRDLAVKLEQSDFLRNSRKLFNEVFLIVQKEDRLDKSFRELWEFRTTFRRIKWLPFLNRFILQVREHADTGVRVSTKWWAIDKRLYALYDSFSTYTNFSVDNLETVQPVELPKPKKEKSAMLRVLMLCALVYGCWTVISKLTKSSVKPPAVVPAAAPASSAAPAAAPAAEKPVGPRVYVENFRGFFLRTLRTDGGEYTLGALSNHGRVLAVSPQGARLLGFDGEAVLVVAAQAGGAPVVAGKGAPGPAAVGAAPAAGAAWSPRAFPLDRSLGLPPRDVRLQFRGGVALRSEKN